MSESGYFDSAASSKPLLHLWSLGIEEQFYIFWPALLWLAFRMKAIVGRLLAVLFLASFAINVALSITNISDDFYLPASRLWEFLAGAGLAWRRQVVLHASGSAPAATCSTTLESCNSITPILRSGLRMRQR